MQTIPFTKNPLISTSSNHFAPECASISLNVSKQAWGFGQMRLYPSSEGFVCANECSSKETCIDFFSHFLLSLPSQASFVAHTENFKNVRKMTWDDFHKLLDFQEKETDSEIESYINAEVRRKSRASAEGKEFHSKAENLNNHYFNSPEILNVYVDGTKITYSVNVPGLFDCLVLVVDVSKMTTFKSFNVFYDDLREFDAQKIPESITTEYGQIEEYFSAVLGFVLSERHCLAYDLNIEKIVLEGSVVSYPSAMLSEKQVNVADIGNLNIHMEKTSGYIFNMRVQEGEKTYHIGFVENVVRTSKYGEIVDKKICITYDCPEELIYRAFAQVFNEMALEDD